ncbi:PIN-like domain-containing protein [Bacillus safensis]|uniref:PIN-like domain-containing protein n=1 Tax=Bacillus safensis TaxID=561879 RepID=UPI003C1DE6D0
MREKFREFYFDRDDKKIWEESIIVLDTNVLLNLYRYSKETSDQIIGLLNKYRDNLWMPHQVALEYHYNRKSVLVEQSGSYKKVCNALNEIPEKIRDMLNQDLSNYKKRHKGDVENFIEIIQAATNKHIEELNAKNEKNTEYNLTDKDSIKLEITKLYNGKVGDPYTKDEMEALEKEADDRLKKEIPPGYKDYNKKKGHKFHNGVMIQNKYGDLILWKQLLRYAKDKNTSVIFLTDEQKEDWWYDLKSRIIGPKVELLNEFTNETNKEFHMFNSLGFVKRHRDVINDDTVSEVRELDEYYRSTENLRMGRRFSKPFIPDYLDQDTLAAFCFWFDKKFSKSFFKKIKFSTIYEIIENEFDDYTAKKIMSFLYKENLVKEDVIKQQMYIKMDQLKARVHETILNLSS